MSPDPDDFPLWQRVAITLAAVLSSALSIAGSGVICHMAAQRRYSVKYRLLFALSAADLINSVVFLLWPLPIPADAPESAVWGAVGNRTTCNVQGFFLQFGVLGSFYNASLSGYFMWTLCDRLTERQIARRYELLVHVVSLTWSVGTAVLALWPLDLYAPCALGCWIAPQPIRCHHREDVDCVRNDRSYLYAWLFTGIPLLLCLGFIVVTMGRIYGTVRAVSERADRITFRASVDRHVGSVRSMEDAATSGGGEPSEQFVVTTTGAGAEAATEEAIGPTSPTAANALPDARNNRQNDDNDTGKDKRRKNREPPQPKSRYAKRVRETALQALLYVVAYVVTHVFAFLCVSIEQAGGINPFATLFLENLLWPLQGFLNVFVFLRPKIRSLRRDDPDLSYVRAAIIAAWYDGRDPHREDRRHQRAARRQRRGETWRRDRRTRLTTSGHAPPHPQQHHDHDDRDDHHDHHQQQISEVTETPVGMARRLSSHVRSSQVSFGDNHNYASNDSCVDSTRGVGESKCELSHIDDDDDALVVVRERREEREDGGGDGSTLSLERPHETVEAIAETTERYHSKMARYAAAAADGS